jgi:hypothetical protein
MKATLKPAKAAQTATAPTPATQETADTSLSALSWFKEALIIAAVTIIGAWYVLLFEVGYLSYFHIAYYFISLSPSIILGTSFHWVNLLLFLCGYVIALILATSFLVWLSERWKKKRKERGETREPVVLKLVGSVIFLFFFILLVREGAFFFRLKGYEHAKTLQEFYVFTINFDSFKSDVAVIRTYGEHVYAVPFKRDTTKIDQSGRKTVEFEKQLIIVKMSDIKAPLSVEKIGHLQAKPEEESTRDQSKK